MGVTHERSDTYMLQAYIKGIWFDEGTVSKHGASAQCRNSAKKGGVPARVWNMTKNALYVEARP